MSYMFEDEEAKRLPCKDCVFRKYDGVFSWGEPYEGYRYRTCTQYIRKPSEIWEYNVECYLYKKQEPGETLIWDNESKGKVYFTDLLREEG